MDVEVLNIDDIYFTEDGYAVSEGNETYIEDKDFHVYHTGDYFLHDDDGKYYSYEQLDNEDESEVA